MLDKLKLNPITSLLGKAGKGISNVEGEIVRAVKNLLAKVRK